MNNDNGFELLTVVVFNISPQLGGLGTKDQYLVISFRLGEGENIPQFHLRAIQIRNENFLLQDQTRNNQQPHRKFFLGTVKIETSPKIHDSL